MTFEGGGNKRVSLHNVRVVRDVRIRIDRASGSFAIVQAGCEVVGVPA